MNALLDLLANRSLAIGLAVTAVLTVAALAISVSRNPLHRERTAELGIVGAAFAFALVLVPLPGPVGQLSRSLVIESGTESLPNPQRSLLNNWAPLADRPLRHEGVDLPDALTENLVTGAPSRSSAQVPVSAGSTSVARTQIKAQHDPAALPRNFAMVFLWGAVAMLAYLALSAFVLARIGRGAKPMPAWLTASLPASGSTQLLICARSSRPFCFGLRARIVLPAHLVHRGNTSLLHSVVQHELAHVQLGHLRWRQAIAACSVLLFAHPLFWWLARQQRQASELLADDLAAAQVGKNRYVEHLIGLVEKLRPAQRHIPLSTLSLSVLGAPQSADGPFYQRMRTLLMRPTTLQTRLTRRQVITRGTACAALLAGVAIALGRPAFAQERTEVSGETPFAAPASGAIQNTTLEKAVSEFNRLSKTRPIGKGQPPLTAASVVAAIRWSLLPTSNLEVSKSTREALRNVTLNHILPEPFRIEALTTSEPDGKTVFTMWSVRLRVPIEGPGSHGATTCIRIREAMINSRIMGPAEQAVVKQEGEYKSSSQAQAFLEKRRAAIELDRRAATLTPHGYAPNTKGFEIIEQVVDGTGKLLAVYTTSSKARRKCTGHYEVTDKVLDKQGRTVREVRTFEKGQYVKYRLPVGPAVWSTGELQELSEKVCDAQGRLLHTVVMRETDHSGALVTKEQRVESGRKPYGIIIFDGIGRQSADFMLLEVVRAENVSENVYNTQGEVRHRIIQKGFDKDGGLIYEVWEKRSKNAVKPSDDRIIQTPEGGYKIWDEPTKKWVKLRVDCVESFLERLEDPPAGK